MSGARSSIHPSIHPHHQHRTTLHRTAPHVITCHHAGAIQALAEHAGRTPACMIETRHACMYCRQSDCPTGASVPRQPPSHSERVGAFDMLCSTHSLRLADLCRCRGCAFVSGTPSCVFQQAAEKKAMASLCTPTPCEGPVGATCMHVHEGNTAPTASYLSSHNGPIHRHACSSCFRIKIKIATAAAVAVNWPIPPACCQGLVAPAQQARPGQNRFGYHGMHVVWSQTCGLRTLC